MTAEFGSDPTLRSYAQLVRRRKWWVIALGLAGLGVSLAISFTEPKQYAATAQLLVQPSSQTLIAHQHPRSSEIPARRTRRGGG